MEAKRRGKRSNQHFHLKAVARPRCAATTSGACGRPVTSRIVARIHFVQRLLGWTSHRFESRAHVDTDASDTCRLRASERLDVEGRTRNWSFRRIYQSGSGIVWIGSYWVCVHEWLVDVGRADLLGGILELVLHVNRHSVFGGCVFDDQVGPHAAVSVACLLVENLRADRLSGSHPKRCAGKTKRNSRAVLAGKRGFRIIGQASNPRLPSRPTFQYLVITA